MAKPTVPETKANKKPNRDTPVSAPSELPVLDVEDESEETNEIVVKIKPSQQTVESLAQVAAESLDPNRAQEEEPPLEAQVEAEATPAVESEGAKVEPQPAKSRIVSDEPAEEPIQVRVAPIGSKRVIKPLKAEEKLTPLEATEEDEAEENTAVATPSSAAPASVSAFDRRPDDQPDAPTTPNTKLDAADSAVGGARMQPVDTALGRLSPAAANQLVLDQSGRDYKINKKNLKHPPKAIRQQKQANLTQVIIVVTAIYLVVGALYVYADRYGIIG